MISELIVLGATFASVFGKALQQKNVVGNDYILIMPTSLFIQICDVSYIYLIASEGWSMIVPSGIGAGLGCMTAMYVYNKFRGKKDD